MWFVSWNVIYHRSIPSKTCFSPLYHCYRKLLPLLSPFYFQRGSQQTPFCFHFLQNIGQQLINLTSAIIMLFAECFSAVFRNIAHALDKQKRSCKAGQSVYIGKKLSTKRRSLFYESAILWENLFSYKQILIFQLNSFIRLELA